MRSKLFFFVFLLSVPFFSAHAQPGWQWGKTSLPSGNSEFDAMAMALDDSGNVLVTGVSGTGAGPGATDSIVFGADTVYNRDHSGQQIVIKTDSNGHILWANGSQHANVEYPLGIAADHSGNVYVYGNFRDDSICSFGAITLSNPSFYHMYYLVKYSPGGAVIWAKSIIGNTNSVGLGSMGLDDAGNIYVTGFFNLPSVTIGATTLTNTASGGTFDVFVAKYDALGNPLWAKSFGGADNDAPYAMTVTKAGNLYITGRYDSPTMTVGSTTLTNPTGYYPWLPFVAKMDSSGHVAWAENQNIKITVNNLTHDAAENIYMVGYIDSSVIIGADTLINRGSYDVFLAKYDSSGHFKWANSAGGPNSDQGFGGIAIDNNNNLWITCGSTGAGTFMTFNADTVVLPPGNDIAVIAEYNDSGVYKKSLTLTSGGDDFLGIMADNHGNFYIGGDLEGYSMIFGPDTLTGPLYGNEEFLVARYGYDTAYNMHHATLQIPVQQVAASPGHYIFLFPNPAADEVTIHSSVALPAGSRVDMYDVTGRLIQTCSLSGNDTIVPLRGFAPGIYQCRIYNQGGLLETKKLAVM